MTHKRPGSAPAARMSDAQYALTLYELCRVVLGGRPERPELQPTKAELVAYHKESRIQQRWVAPKRKFRHQDR
jgi:hypothetical protein